MYVNDDNDDDDGGGGEKGQWPPPGRTKDVQAGDAIHNVKIAVISQKKQFSSYDEYKSVILPSPSASDAAAD